MMERLLIHLQLHLSVMRCSRSGGAGDRDGVDSSLRAAAGGVPLLDDPQPDCNRTAPAIRQRTAPASQRRRLRPKPRPSPTRLRPPMGSQGGVERAAAEQTAGDYGAGHRSDAQRCACRSAPRKRDGRGGEDGSGCRHHRRRSGLAGGDGGVITQVARGVKTTWKLTVSPALITGVEVEAEKKALIEKSTTFARLRTDAPTGRRSR